MNTVVRIEGLYKEYRLGTIGYGMLYKDLQSWIARIRGKPDPNAQIGKEIGKDINSRFWALKNITLDIQQGSRLGIIGRNGAGKSTLLKILSRVTAPTKGTIKVNGRISSLLEVGTGFHPELTGRENVFLNGAILGMRHREIDRKMDQILSFAEIEKFADTPVKRYSSGMFVRLAFSVAAHLENEILLADEVLAVGDIPFQNKCINKMREVSRNEGRTIIYVSHNMGSLLNLCDSGVVLRSGEVAYSGDIESCIDKYLSLNAVSSGDEIITSKCRRFSLKTPYWVSAQGESVQSYEFGEDIILRFEFDFKYRVKKINVGFAVIDRLGQRVFTSHMEDDHSYYNREGYEGAIVVDTIFDIYSLSPGRYSVTFGVRDENEDTVILSEHDLVLEITQGKEIKNAADGILWHTSKWRLLK